MRWLLLGPSVPGRFRKVITRAIVFFAAALLPCVAFSQTTKPVDMFSSFSSTVSTIVTGLLVVVVGYALYTGIIKALRGMGWYNDPILEIINEGLGKVTKALDAQASTITNLTGVVSDHATRLDALSARIQAYATRNDEIEAETTEICKLTEQIALLLNHEDYGNRRLWDQIRGLIDSSKETSREVLQSIERVKDDTSSVKNHIKNEVFKERQTKAFDTIYLMNDAIRKIAKAVQTDDHLPMGQTIPATFCQHDSILRKLERMIGQCETGIKAHRADLDKEVAATLGTLLVLIEQLVKRSERVEHRLRDFVWPPDDT